MHNFTATPPNRLGHFSPQTASTNFCELDYEITPYIAEFVNAITNITYLYLSITSLPRRSTAYNPSTWPVANLALFSVGIGSYAYHATLKHGTEMLDELSMYAIIAALNYGVYIQRSFTSRSTRGPLGIALLLPIAAVSYSNYTSKTGVNFVAHLVLFASYVTAFWLRTYQLIHHYSDRRPHQKVNQQQRPSPQDLNSKTMSVSKAYDDVVRNRRRSSFNSATITFILAFVLWIIDGLCCEQLRAIRAAIGLPFAWAFELHGHWHILTAVSAARFVCLVAEMTEAD